MADTVDKNTTKILLRNNDTLNGYMFSLGDNISNNQNETKLGQLKEAANKLGKILSEDEANNVIKKDIETINSFQSASPTNDFNTIKNNFENNRNKLKFVEGFEEVSDNGDENNASVDVNKPDVKELTKPITEYNVFNDAQKFKVTTEKGNYVVFKTNGTEFDTLTGGKKSRKSKTHRQKKVHRSTQKRNGRKRTSHRRK